MANNKKINVTELDFDNIKANIKEYLKGQCVPAPRKDKVDFTLPSPFMPKEYPTEPGN